MSTNDPTAVPWSPDSPRATGAELVEMLTTPPVPWPLDEEVEQYLPQWDGDPALRRVLLGLIRSGNAADTRNLDDAHALLMFGQSCEPLARALLDTIRAEVAAALADVSDPPPAALT